MDISRNHRFLKDIISFCEDLILISNELDKRKILHSIHPDPHSCISCGALVSIFNEDQEEIISVEVTPDKFALNPHVTFTACHENTSVSIFVYPEGNIADEFMRLLSLEPVKSLFISKEDD